MSHTKVLIVDDEVEFASTLSERLSLRNYDAKAIYCAEDAIAAARSEPLDVVLLDLKIPGMNGLELLNIIKQYDSTIEVIILTGQLTGQDEAEAVRSGAFDYIIKPVDINELTAKINKAAEKRRFKK